MSEVKTNKITSLASNNDITLDPDGTGNTNVDNGDFLFLEEAASSPYPEQKIKWSNDSTTANGFYVSQDTSRNGRVWHEQGVDLVFGTTNTERMRIDSSGHVLFGQSSTDSPGVGNTTAGAAIRGTGISFFSASGSAPGRFNRSGDDGVLIAFYQAGTQEGTISVSGSTVSYNGGHLSRWSQATDGNRIDGLVKGTVMTNLDQMAVWSHAEVLWTADDELPDGVSVGDVRTAAYTEDNEQLNCMAVSSVEGDANVAGVFVNWDDDDTDFTADMNVAMTGDMVIRIASGTTVARGDLLMSAGDGTAKPQDDDIVRSKTIAKVTSTTKSHTYDDGSYLVPCVLMAC